MITISWQVAAMLLIAFGCTIFGFGRVLLNQFEKRMDERRKTNADAIKALSLKLDVESAQIRELERNVTNAVGELPLHYVRREDWIRFSATIDAKLDRLAELYMKDRQKG